MFSVHDFIMKTALGMIGNYPDFQVREFATKWWEKGVLTTEDLAAIDEAIEASHVQPEPEDTEAGTGNADGSRL